MGRKKKEEYVSFYEYKDEDEEYPGETDLIGKKRFYLGFTQRVIWLFILSILCILSSFFGFKNGINFNNTKIYKYSESGILDYRVFLKDNAYYEDKYLDKNMNYLSTIIDYININFNYQLVGNEKTAIKYSYYIDGTLNIYDTKNNNKILYTKDYNLVPKVEKEMLDKQLFELNKELKVDYDYYNNLAKSFKRDFNVAATSDLKIVFHIKAELPDIKENGEVAENSLNMTIPLTEQTIDIKMDSNEIENSNTIIHREHATLLSPTLVILAVIAAILSIILIINLLKLMIKSRPKKSPYGKRLSQILKEYDRAIVTTNSNIRLREDDNIIDVNTFEELLDLRDTLNIPILFMEIHKDQKSWFIIRNDKDVYKYVLKSSDLEKKK